MSEELGRPDGPTEWKGPEQSWPSEAPDVMFGGVRLVESSLAFVGAGEEHEEGAPSTFEWVIKGTPAHAAHDDEEHLHATLIADLFVCDHDFHLSVTAGAPLLTRQGTDEGGLHAEAIEERFGYWASHVLWDVVASEARRQIGSLGAPLTLPFRTPKPTLAHELPEPVVPHVERSDAD